MYVSIKAMQSDTPYEIINKMQLYNNLPTVQLKWRVMDSTLGIQYLCWLQWKYSICGRAVLPQHIGTSIDYRPPENSDAVISNHHRSSMTNKYSTAQM